MAHYTDGLTSEDMTISARVFAHPVRALAAHKDDNADYRRMLSLAKSRAEMDPRFWPNPVRNAAMANRYRVDGITY